jgi:hypothetical protein
MMAPVIWTEARGRDDISTVWDASINEIPVGGVSRFDCLINQSPGREYSWYVTLVPPHVALYISGWNGFEPTLEAAQGRVDDYMKKLYFLLSAYVPIPETEDEVEQAEREMELNPPEIPESLMDPDAVFEKYVLGKSTEQK